MNARITVGTYEGHIYGWDLIVKEDAAPELKMTYGYSAHQGCVKTVAYMDQAKTSDILVSGGQDEMIK